ncbi:MAG TPA: site-2 protease family protein [Verrucomicrobiae bacterium]|nr:site-2 protease family protein [Verrucomicrobiae bacterium]
MPTKQGSIHLFRLFGIDVYLHWAWFFAVWYFVYGARGNTSTTWSVLECLALFAIVLIHEFGHQLACRSVGGKTHDIILWPLGGVAYVSPPQRPGAQLWSIAAGPLVNVVLFPIFTVVLLLARSAGWGDTMPDAWFFVLTLWYINTGLLLFNMLPIYPLDGGQILRSLLWFVFGRARSLMIATVIGLVGIVAFIPFLIMANQMWYYLLAGFAVLNCWGGLMQARALARVANAPRRNGFACPNCQTAPPQGAFWLCGKCRNPFDTFATQGLCPNCNTQYSATSCPECGTLHPFSKWMTSTNVPPTLP